MNKKWVSLLYYKIRGNDNSIMYGKPRYYRGLLKEKLDIKKMKMSKSF